MTHVCHVHHRPGIREHGRQFGEDEGQQQDGGSPDHPREDAPRPRQHGGMQRAEQPAGTDDAAETRVQEPDHAHVAPEFRRSRHLPSPVRPSNRGEYYGGPQGWK